MSTLPANESPANFSLLPGQFQIHDDGGTTLEESPTGRQQVSSNSTLLETVLMLAARA